MHQDIAEKTIGCVISFIHRLSASVCVLRPPSLTTYSPRHLLYSTTIGDAAASGTFPLSAAASSAFFSLSWYSYHFCETS